MRENLLFVTCHDENCEEDLSYAIDLAKIMNKGITILLVYKNNLMKRFQDRESVFTMNSGMPGINIWDLRLHHKHRA